MVVNVLQALLFILSVSGYLLVSHQNKYSIYGYYLGLLSQPLWFLSAYLANQWAVMLMVVFYTYGNIIGIKKFHEV